MAGGVKNRYEACLRFTYPEAGARAVTKFHAGGVGAFPSASAVLTTVFDEMAWVEDGTDKVMGTIHSYRK